MAGAVPLVSRPLFSPRPNPGPRAQLTGRDGDRGGGAHRGGEGKGPAVSESLQGRGTRAAAIGQG